MERPVWPCVETCIDRAFEFGGMVRLHVGRASSEDSHAVEYFQFLGMDSIPGKFRILFSPEYKETDERLNKLLWWEAGDTAYRGQELFGDDEWDARTVCTDVRIAKQIFQDVFDHGDLTKVSCSQMRSVWDPKPR